MLIERFLQRDNLRKFFLILVVHKHAIHSYIYTNRHVCSYFLSTAFNNSIRIMGLQA